MNWRRALGSDDSVTETFTITASKEVMEKFKRFLSFFHYNGGHSGLFAMEFDGDGSDRMKVSPEPGKEFSKGVGRVGGIGDSVEIANSDGFSTRSLRDPIYPYYRVADSGSAEKVTGDNQTEALDDRG